jgi:hypothetical protein
MEEVERICLPLNFARRYFFSMITPVFSKS